MVFLIISLCTLVVVVRGVMSFGWVVMQVFSRIRNTFELESGHLACEFYLLCWQLYMPW